MSGDPIDDLGERLFDAARRESPPAGAEQRLLAAALREVEKLEPARAIGLRSGVTWGVVSSALLIAAGIALFLGRPKPTDPISAEPDLARTTSAAKPRPADSAPTASGLPASLPTPSTAHAPLSAPRASASAAITLSDEIDALKVASSALSAGNAQAALSALDRYDHVLKGTRLRAEATLLRIQALARAGNPQAASTLAQRFVDQNPDSPLVDRARSFIQTPSLGGN